MCSLVPVRLVNGLNSHSGRVEVYATIDGISQWGTVCDYHWDIEDARVVCRQLGFLDAVSAPPFAHYGEGTGLILFHGVHCLGNESDIFACSHNESSYYTCHYHFEDASAECLGIVKCYIV